MKIVVTFLFYFIIPASANNQLSAVGPKFYKEAVVYKDTIRYTFSSTTEATTPKGIEETPPCKGNGIVTFVNSSSQPLWFYYWYPDDVRNASNECKFRRFWKQLDTGNNQFIIPKEKTLIFRICTSTECLNSVIKQFGIVNYCKANNETIRVN